LLAQISAEISINPKQNLPSEESVEIIEEYY
ncbi:conserved hypothetical protein, partial [Trichinella spiralis]